MRACFRSDLGAPDALISIEGAWSSSGYRSPACVFAPCVHMELRALDGGGEERAGYRLECPEASRVAMTFLLLKKIISFHYQSGQKNSRKAHADPGSCC